MREAWIQLLLCIHTPTSSWIPLSAFMTSRFLVQIPSGMCLFVVGANAYRGITSIESSAYNFFVLFCLLVYVSIFFLLPLKDRRILDCVCG